MADGRNIEIRIAATGGDQAAQEFRKVETAQDGISSASGKTGAKLEEFRSQGQKVTSATMDMRMGLQNVGYQVQDFAVQVGSGTSAVRAFSQQAPQLLSAFGPWGVGLGTVVALGAPLVSQLFDQAEATDQLSDAMEEARLKTIALSAQEEDAKRIQEEWTRTAYELNEAVRDATTARYGYNEALRKGLEILKEEQDARNQVESARGKREIEEAEGDPVRQEQVRNRVRREAQARELADMQEMQKRRRDLLERDSQQQLEVGQNGPSAVDAIQRRAEEARKQALEYEQAKIIAEGNAASYREFGNRPSASAQERMSSERDARIAEKSAKDWDALAKESRGLADNLTASADDAAKTISGTIDKLQKEMQKLADEIRSTDLAISTKQQVFAEENASGESRLQRARTDAAKKTADEREKQEREAQQARDRERTQAIAAAVLGMDASKVAGESVGGKAGAALKSKAEALLANPTAKGQQELLDLVDRLIDLVESKGDAEDVSALKQKVQVLEARQRNGRDGR